MFSNVQMLRAYAAVLVVLYHSLPHYEAMNGSSAILKSISAWGFAGVDIFFVISGFVIAHSTLYKERNIGNCIRFLRHRLSRIYLGYWPFFVAAYLAALTFSPSSLEGIDLFDSFFLTSTNMFELLLPVSWSLGYELYFYIFFALLFAVRSETVKVILPVIFVAIALVSVFIHIENDSLLSFFLSPFLLEFLSGALLYICKDKLNNKWLIILGVLVAVSAYSYGVHIDAKNGVYRIYTFGVASFAVVLIALTLEQCGMYKANKYIAAIGDSSYTLYLSHLLLLQLFYFSGIRTYLSSQNQWLVEVGFASFILFCVSFSYFFYSKVELPLYKLACKIKFKPLPSSIITKT